MKGKCHSAAAEWRSAHDDPPRDRRLMPARTRALSQWSGSSADLLLSLVRTHIKEKRNVRTLRERSFSWTNRTSFKITLTIKRPSGL
jgi:hypothetical protein